MKKSGALLVGSLFLVLIIVSGVNAASLDYTGTWAGVLHISGAELQLIFRITCAEDGVLQGTLDVPAQAAYGIPLSKVDFQADSAIFEVLLIGGIFQGELNSAGNLAGTWSQSGMELPLLLSLVGEEDPTQLSRPQEPQPPYPYGQEDVFYPNISEGFELAGTLTVPQGAGPFPAVLLISGSGPQDRNEEVFGHKPFLVLADYLTRQGIAVLRVDDRGVGDSGGEFGDATTLDFAQDAAAGFRFLQSREEIDSKSIGLIGHSEGGLIAPLVALENKEVAFIVMLAGPGLTGAEITKLQTRLILEAEGLPEELIERESWLQGRLVDIALKELQQEQALTQVELVLEEYLEKLTAVEREDFMAAEAVMQAQIEELLGPWFRFFLAYDPLPVLTQVNCPVLAVNGTLDLQVPFQENLEAIEQALQKGGNQSHKVLALPGLNHLFQTAGTGAPSEYPIIEETMAPQILEIVADWILEITGE